MNYKFIFLSVFSLSIIFFSSCKNDTTKKEDKKEVSKKEIKAETKSNELDEGYAADYIAKSISIAKASGKTLKGKLTAAVEKGGLQNGINTCNKIAQKLMDSLSNKYNVQIKRTTLKLRNPDDKPEQDEIDVLITYDKQIKSGKIAKPSAKKLNNGNVRVYIPIMVDKVCLNCHGKIGEDIKASNYSLIKKHYPNDEAIDYSDGDLRGIWSITYKGK